MGSAQIVRKLVVVPIAVVALGWTTACSGGNAAAPLAKPPEFAPKDQTKCGVKKSTARPLIVEWPSADRATLEAEAKRGLIAVRYIGCEMEVLTGCKAPGTYSYTALTRKDDRLAIRDADELYATIPAFAAKFEAKLQTAGELDVDMTIVGRWATERIRVRRGELTGDCRSATHVVTGLTAGAFEFFAGAEAAVGGGVELAGARAGGRSAAKRELLNRDGDKAACDKATIDDRAPPFGCGALLRLEVVPVDPSVRERLGGRWVLVGDSRPAFEAYARRDVQNDETKLAQTMKGIEQLTRGFTLPLWIDDEGGRVTVYVGDTPISRSRYEIVREDGESVVTRMVGNDEITKKHDPSELTLTLQDDGTFVATNSSVPGLREIYRRK